MLGLDTNQMGTVDTVFGVANDAKIEEMDHENQEDHSDEDENDQSENREDSEADEQ